MKSVKGQVTEYHSLGNVACGMEDFEKAKAYYQKVMDISIKMDNRYRQALTYSAFGFMYQRMGNKEKSRENLEKSIEIFNELDSRDEAGMVRYMMDSAGYPE